MSSGGGADPAGVLADRVFRYHMPLWLLYLALTERQSSWLRLQPGEVEPRVIKAVPIERVVWSSFWPVSPAGIIEVSLSTDGKRPGKIMRVRWVRNSPADQRGKAITGQ